MSVIRLKSVQYAERVGRRKQWTMDGLTLGPINLMVGRNATGKTRALNVIWNLARLFIPEPKYRTANAGYDLLFDNNGDPLRYVLQIEEGKVTREAVYVAGNLMLNRGAGGEGEIFTKEEHKNIRFRPPEDELAAVARRDSLQHPFLEPLHEWATSVRHYMFGTHLGKTHIVVPIQGGPEPDERDAGQVVAIFRKGQQILGQEFVDAVKRDMIEMKYDVEEIDTFVPENIRVLRAGVPAEAYVLGVRERGVDGFIDQGEMSQGMFRALSILIQVNYSQMAKRANCILIDDIGEGLDYERSTLLIQILRGKAKESSFQLVMTTNDQFVMNNVPLEEWSVLQRTGSEIRVRNHENSGEEFEEFRFIGLSNFSFFEMDFANGQPEEEKTAHE